MPIRYHPFIVIVLLPVPQSFFPPLASLAYDALLAVSLAGPLSDRADVLRSVFAFVRYT